MTGGNISAPSIAQSAVPIAGLYVLTIAMLGTTSHWLDGSQNFAEQDHDAPTEAVRLSDTSDCAASCTARRISACTCTAFSSWL